MIEQVNPEKDTAVISNSIPKLLAAATPKPSYYQNFRVGECRDLIFGVSLVDYATTKGLAEGEVPKIVRLCIKEIDERGLEAEGIYRVSQSLNSIYLSLTSFLTLIRFQVSGRHASILEVCE